MADRKLLLYRGSQLLAQRLLSPGDWYMQRVADGKLVLLRHALPGGRTDYLWLDSQTLEQTGSPIADRDSYRHLTLLGGDGGGLLAWQGGGLSFLGRNGTYHLICKAPLCEWRNSKGALTIESAGAEAVVLASIGGVAVFSLEHGLLWSQVAPRFGSGELQVAGLEDARPAGDFILSVYPGSHTHGFDGVPLGTGENLLIYNIASRQPRSYVNVPNSGAARFSFSGNDVIVLSSAPTTFLHREDLRLTIYALPQH
jgi:hypothetical protein